MNPYFEKFKVRAAEIGPYGTVKPTAVINYFQEAAWQHAGLLGVSVPALMEKGHTWVLHRLFLRIVTPLMQNQQVEIETWPSDIERFFTFRDFRFRNDQKELVAEGCTAWVVIDINKRKLIPMPDYITAGDFAIENNHLPHPVEKLPDPTELVDGPGFRVYYQHLDQNNHVNNVHYLEWMLASVPQDYFLHMELKEVDIQFKSECRLNDEIVSGFKQMSDDRILLSLKEKHSQREVATAISLWREK